jgi:hypothetical protein
MPRASWPNWKRISGHKASMVDRGWDVVDIA